MKTAVRVAGLVCVVTMAWAFMPLAATASFAELDMGEYYLWSQPSTHTYFQQYKADYSWKVSTDASSNFNYLGKLGDLSTLLFDGSFHKFTDNNYSYEFWASGTGVWQNASLNLNQFAYDYNSGQWWNQGNWGGWQTLGSTGLSTAFMGDSASHSLGNNWSYLFDGTYAYWKNAGMNLNQFAYNYTTGNWYDQGQWGGWASLGPSALSASFVGDGAWHTFDSNWGYMYAGTYGYWKNAGMNLSQFAYSYTTGQWYDQGQWGGWASLGPLHLSASFMGDTNYHALDNTWSYAYGSGSGYWKDGSTLRFAYEYTKGQWSDTSAYNYSSLGTIWSPIGGAIGRQAAAFIGDGSSHPTGVTNWDYYYDEGTGRSTYVNWLTFQNGPPGTKGVEYDYYYGTGQWVRYDVISYYDNGWLVITQQPYNSASNSHPSKLEQWTYTGVTSIPPPF